MQAISDPEIIELALTRHALNVLILEFDWQRAIEAVRVDDVDSVSDIVRYALAKYLDEHPRADLLRDFAQDALKFELSRRKRREPYLPTGSESGGSDPRTEAKRQQERT